MFCGREDVFARRWYSKTTEKSGYQPVCENEWADGLCDKRKYKCSVCPNRKLSPLTDKDIYKHLEGKDYYGKDVIGIYPMLVDDNADKPWETKQKTLLTSMDFPDKLEIVRSNMIYIPREGLSANAQNQIKRLAAFKNPDFYKSQAMRLPIYDKPRIICTADITDSYIGLPRGCEPALCDMLVDKVKNIDIIDKTNAGENIPVEFNGNLREEQELAVSELLKYNIGVLSATTAFGKTVIASYIVSQRKTNTLVLVHTQALMQQWKKSLEQFLTFDITHPEQRKGRGRKKTWSPVGLLGAGKDALNGIVDVAVMQSLVDGDEVKELVRNYGMIIVDECHHVSAVNFEKILKYANAKYVYGLTATSTRQDGHHPIIFMQCGPIRYRVDAKAQAEKREFEHYLIPRFTSFRNIADDNITALYKKLSDDAMRNNLIVNDVVAAIKNGRTPIILSERREHVTMLTELLKPHCDNVIEIVGTTSAKSRRETLERLDNIPQEESLVVVATGRYVGEGFDYLRLDTLFLALPIAWKGKVAQYAGRLHRNYQGKTEVQVYDYIDIHLPVLERMYQKRVKSYSAIGYKTKITTSSNASPDLIYDGKTFYPVFCRDVEITQNEILIVSPFMRKARLTQMLKVLSPLIMNKVTVTVVTRPSEDFKEKNKQIVIECTEQLKQYGIKVVYKSDFHQKFAIIDQSVVWYGSVNFLSFGTQEESIMRIENSDVAHQLMDTIL